MSKVQKSSYSTVGSGVCCAAIHVCIIDGLIDSVVFEKGCAGNHQGIAALVRGMPAEEAIRRLAGTRCGQRPTSCPDQLAKALQAARQAEQ